MPVTVYAAFYRGIDRLTLSSGEGLSQPQLSSAVAVDINRVRLTFSADMDFVHGSKILDVRSYEMTLLPSTDQWILRAEQYSSTQVDLIVQNQTAVQYRVTVVGALQSTTGQAIDPYFVTATYYGATPSTPTGTKLYSFYGLEAGLQDKEQQTLPPLLVEQPVSPNPDLTSPLHPMVWVSNDFDSDSSIVLLVIEGVDAVVNNVIQPEFFGTCVPNGQGGYDISINAVNDMWPGRSRISWQIKLADLYNISNYSGTIDKEVTLPFLEPDVEREAFVNVSFDFPFRFTATGSLERSRDEKSVEDNMRNAIMIRAGGIPLFSRIGSRVPFMPYDPNDQALVELIGVEVVSAIAVGEQRVVANERVRVVTDASGNAIALVVPYMYRSTLKGWKDFRLEEPEFKTVDKGNR